MVDKRITQGYHDEARIPNYQEIKAKLTEEYTAKTLLPFGFEETFDMGIKN